VAVCQAESNAKGRTGTGLLRRVARNAKLAPRLDQGSVEQVKSLISPRAKGRIEIFGCPRPHSETHLHSDTTFEKKDRLIVFVPHPVEKRHDDHRIQQSLNPNVWKGILLGLFLNQTL
jgi:hypothetical protein